MPDTEKEDGPPPSGRVELQFVPPAVPRAPLALDGRPEILREYECGPVPLPTDPEAAYLRHLVFDHIVDPARASMRQRFQAAARSLRDLLAQRWLKTKQTYQRENPKRVYYLSMEFLLG